MALDTGPAGTAAKREAAAKKKRQREFEAKARRAARKAAREKITATGRPAPATLKKPPKRTVTTSRGSDSAEAAAFVRSALYQRIRSRDDARALRRLGASEEQIASTRRGTYTPTALSGERVERRDPAFAGQKYDAAGQTAWSPEDVERAQFIDSRTGTNFKVAAKQLLENIYYTPAGLQDLTSAVGFDVRDLATGRDFTPTRSKDLAVDIGRATAYTAQHPEERPGDALLLAFAGASGLAGGVSRVGAAAGAARAAGRLGRSPIRAALTRAPAEGGSLLRRPVPGRIELEPGTSVPASPNALVRLLQRRRAKAQQERPEATFVGARPGRTLPARVGKERQRREAIIGDVERGAAAGLAKTGRKADDVVNRAVLVVGEGVPIRDRIARHERDLASIDPSTSKGRQHTARLEDEIALLRDVERSGLIENVDGKPRPTAKLAELYARARESGARREETLKELGLMEEAGLETRRAAPGKFMRHEGEESPAGELFVSYAEKKPRIGRPQLGGGKVVGIPKQDVVGKHAFTGEAIRQGRVPRDVVKRVAEGELAATRYQSVTRLREQAARESITADAYQALPADVRKNYQPVRISGKPFNQDTRRFLDDIEAKQERGQRLTPDEQDALTNSVERVREFFFPRKGTPDYDLALSAAAKGQVRFFDRRRFGDMTKAQEPVTMGQRKFVRWMDEFNSAKDITDLMARIGYGAPNLASQIALTISAGVSPVDMVLTARLFRHLNPEQKGKIRGARGGGIAEAGMGPRTRGRVKTLRNWMANKWGIVLDDPWRQLVFVKHAREKGYNTPAKITTLLDKKHRDDLVEVAERTRDDMLDYEKMGTAERNYVSRAIRFYPFLKASSVFTGKFVRDRPIQAAVLMQLAARAKEQAGEDLGNLPFYRRGLFKVGGTQDEPLVVDPRAAQMFDVPGTAANLVGGLTDEQSVDSISLGEMLSPAGQVVLTLVDPRVRLTGEQKAILPALRENVLRTPQERLIMSFFGKPDEGEEEDKQLPSSPAIERGRYLGGGFYPRPLNKKAMEAAAKEAGRSTLDAAERAYRAVFDERMKFWEAAQEVAPEILKGQGGRFSPELREAFNRKAAVERERARVDSETEPSTVERERGKFEAETRLLVKWKAITAAQLATAIKWARTATADEIATDRRKLTYKYFSPIYGDRILQARHFLEEQGADLGSY